MLNSNGATRVDLDLTTPHAADFSKITHIVAFTADFPAYFDAIDCFVNVVRPSWITGCLTSNRRQNPRLYSPDPALFMSNVTVYCSDIPEGDVEAIHTVVRALGGVASSTLSRTVTHIVALDASQPFEAAASHKLPSKIILPHW